MAARKRRRQVRLRRGKYKHGNYPLHKYNLHVRVWRRPLARKNAFRACVLTSETPGVGTSDCGNGRNPRVAAGAALKRFVRHLGSRKGAFAEA